MSDFDFDDRLIAGAVNDYQENYMRFIKPEGTAAAIATASHRRKVRVASVVAGFAVVMIAAGTAYASLGAGEHAPPPVVGNQNSASPSASPSPSTVPSTGTPSAGATTTGTGTGIHGPDNLNNATLNLPANYTASCPHGSTKFSGGKAGEFTTIEKVLAADVDHDGNTDDVALIACRPGEGYLKQVVVFGRDAAGKFTTMGLVVQVDQKQIYNVLDAKVSGSDVVVQVGDAGTTGTDGGRVLGVLQWRTYGWNGSKFVQTTGSTSFAADATANHLTTSVSSMVFGPQSGGKRTGTMTVTVHNTGSHSVKQASLVVWLADSAMGENASGCPDNAVDPSTALTCQIGTLAPGASKTFTLTSWLTESDAEYAITNGGTQFPEADFQLRLGDQKYGDHNGFTATFN